MPSSLVGTRPSAGTESSASPGLGSTAEGSDAGRSVPGRLAVQRWVHDMTSWQYQRMSAQACPPSGIIRSSGSTMPHSEHWVDRDGRGWFLRCLAIGAPRARDMLVHRNSATSSGTPAGRTAVADGAYAAIVPPANTIIKAFGAVQPRCHNGNHSGPDNSGKPVKFSVSSKREFNVTEATVIVKRNADFPLPDARHGADPSAWCHVPGEQAVLCPWYEVRFYPATDARTPRCPDDWV